MCLICFFCILVCFYANEPNCLLMGPLQLYFSKMTPILVFMLICPLASKSAGANPSEAKADGSELTIPPSSADPGLIFDSASQAGPAGEGVLDPNGDGWISSTAATFSTYPTIEDESEQFEESGWVQIFHVASEPINDLDTGGACGATEVVDNNQTGQHAGYYRLVDTDADPSNRNEYLQFRLRMAQEASGAFGYSILLDTDQSFGSTGSSPDANATSGNPGFEIEILYGSGGGSAGVTMQDVDGGTSGNSTLSFSSPGVRDQKSYARFTNCTSDDPIFVDFYVSIGDMPAGITAQSTLRMVFASSSSPSTALGGSASDIGGVDDNVYPDDDLAFTTVVEATPVLSFSSGYSCDDVDADGVCDDVDNCVDLSACNYDGSVSNVACVFGTTWYADADGDGYGDSSDSQDACSAPSGYVADSTDCDDSDNAINPGAAEACDGIDNDCDSSVDEGVQTTFYRDADGDGLGDSSDSQDACSAPSGYVSDATDLCDDLSACNYDSNSFANAACDTLDACGVCGGSGIPAGDCDCSGNVDDAIGVCGGTCSADVDSDGICDDGGNDLCVDTSANNYTANPSVACTFSAPAITVTDTIMGCFDQTDAIALDLDTLHSGTGTWTYSITQSLTGAYASESLSGSELTIDFSGAGQDSSRVGLSGTNGSDNATFDVLVVEGTYPFVSSYAPNGANEPTSLTGGMNMTFDGGYDVPLTVHYFDDAVFAEAADGSVSVHAYGTETTALTDSSGSLITLPAGDYFITGYTNRWGCFNPEPATSGTPTLNPSYRLVTVPHLVPED